MKKAFLFFATAMLILASCGKDPKKPNKPIDGGDDEGEELITIDGQFADWAALTNVVTIKNSQIWEGETVTEDHQRIDALKVMKLAGDQYNLYIYLEVDESVMYEGGVLKWDNTLTVNGYPGPLMLYFDTDNNSDTGGHEWEFDVMGYEYQFEAGAVFSTEASEVGELAEGTLYKFTGADDAEAWAPGDYATLEAVSGDGIFAGWGKRDGDIIKYELSFTRSFLNITGKKVKVGAVVMQSPDWTMEGALPQGQTEENWKAELAEVTLP